MRLATALLPGLLLVPPSQAATLHVPAEHGTIQAALDAAASGDTVEVACGTYHEHDLAVSNGVLLRSETGDPGCVTIDAEGLGPVLDCDHVSGPVALEGLSLRNGSGGCIRNQYTTLSASRCVLRDTEGSALFSYGSMVSFDECDFELNTGTHGAAINFTGAYIRPGRGIPLTLSSCTFARHAGVEILYIQTFGSILASGCVFVENQGAIASLYQADGTWDGCTFARNTAGPMVHLWDSAASLGGCIVAFNDGLAAPVTLQGSSPAPPLSCCDVFGNAGGDWVGAIAGQDGTAGNLSVNPLFCNPAADALTLAENSPCLPANNSCGVQIGAFGEGCGPVSVEAQSWAGIKAIYR